MYTDIYEGRFLYRERERERERRGQTTSRMLRGYDAILN